MGRTLSRGESFAWEGEFLRVAVPDQAALCFFGWFLVFSSDAFGTLARMISGNAGTWNSCPFLPPSVQTEASRVCPQTQRWAPVSGGPPRPGRISDPTQLFFRQEADAEGCSQAVSSAWACLRLCAWTLSGFPSAQATGGTGASCVTHKLRAFCFCGSSPTHSVPDPCQLGPFIFFN